MDSKLERLIYLLHMVSERADAMTASGAGLGSYAAVGRVFNDYVRQARELSGAEMISALDEMEIPADGVDPAAFLGELALRADQIAAELEFDLAGKAGRGEEERNWEDTADALVRLKEAGVDVDDLVVNLTAMGAPLRLDRRRVDQICRLAEAGVDVEGLLEDPSFLHAAGRHTRHDRRFWRSREHRQPRMHRGPRLVTIECGPGPCRPAGERRRAAETDRLDSARGSRSWQIDILSRVEKGEITPDEAAELLKAGKMGEDEGI